MPRLDPLYERLARLALATDDELAVAGGNVMRLHDFVDRPTEDLDLFTSRMGSIPVLTERVRAAFEAADLRVDEDAVSEHLARLTVEGADQRQAIVELIADPRTYPAVERHGLRVLDAGEAATNKLNALWTRAEPRDFGDVETLRLDATDGRSSSLGWPHAMPASSPRKPRRCHGGCGSSACGGVHCSRPRCADVAALRDRFRLWRQELLSTPDESTEGASDTR